jgi:hypothetical protein
MKSGQLHFIVLEDKFLHLNEGVNNLKNLPPLSTGSMWFLTELDYCGRKTFPIYAI